ncbi:hypothetical protein ACH5RR_022261 [Cinchona calisaya]|uniref:LOB domain-containing protein n=1 Tax=Cinchona calisaya TaxID=153742 RepID=A0ABD2Z8E9_9GENT
MSCNGCRILRKGCNENCILRQSLQGIESPQAQANATVFVAKFFGRAGLMSFLSSVLQPQRPALFQSLLYEACGRTVNPVSGVVGLLWTGNWQLCQSAVETVLRGGLLRPITDLPTKPEAQDHDDASEASRLCVNLTTGLPARMAAGGTVKRRSATPEEEEYETTTTESCYEYTANYQNLRGGEERRLLRLFL